MSLEPYYSDDYCTIYHGDCREVLSPLTPAYQGALVTDPPYGIDYRSGAPRREGNARGIDGDKDTSLRDWVLEWWANRGPALVFGSWKVAKPVGTKGVLVWDKGGALGMGDLSIPWKFDHEEIYVLGSGSLGGVIAGRCCGARRCSLWIGFTHTRSQSSSCRCFCRSSLP